MKFNICGFTHKGTGTYVLNEDNMLINGAQLNGGSLCLEAQDKCVCFVSDGVGGHLAGDFASSFILAKICEVQEEQYKDLRNMLAVANDEMIKISGSDEKKKGCACTLSGMIAVNGFIDFIHAGDSEMWLLRNDMFFKITQDEVTDPDDPKSPLTNYFGGGKNVLKMKTEVFSTDLAVKDIFIICSDGLFKCLNTKLVRAVIASDKTAKEKVMKLKEDCLAQGSDDNITVIAVEIVEI